MIGRILLIMDISGLRVASCGLRVACYGVRVAGCLVRVTYGTGWYEWSCIRECKRYSLRIDFDEYGRLIVEFCFFYQILSLYNANPVTRNSQLILQATLN
jgi:hypothetical protein